MHSPDFTELDIGGTEENFLRVLNEMCKDGQCTHQIIIFYAPNAEADLHGSYKDLFIFCCEATRSNSQASLYSDVIKQM
jgi:hypothetical protein